MKGLVLKPKHFRFFLYVILCLNFVASQNCDDATCRPELKCPGPYNCTCKNDLPSRYDFLCPKEGKINFTVYLDLYHEQLMDIHCYSPTRNMDLLKGIKIGQVKMIYFKFCGLPEVSFSELFQTIGVNLMEELSFHSMTNLSFLLKKEHFSGLEHIQTLDLSNNGLMNLPDDLLQGFSSLTWLYLKNNDLTLHKNNFIAVPGLKKLSLENNHIRHLEGGVFANLTNLTHLHLKRNDLQSLSRDVLTDLANLNLLDISENPLINLPADVFEDFEKPFDLYMHSTNISFFPQGIFSKNPKLQSIILKYNEQLLSLSHYFLSNNTHLDLIYIVRNNISTLPESTFWNSSSITTIFLQENHLKSLPQDLFRDQIRLQRLGLENNRLQYLPNYIFKNLAQLWYLNLSHNRLTNICRDVFYGLNRLTTLKLDHNHLNYVDSFPIALAPLQLVQKDADSPGLYKLTLDNNKIESLGSSMIKYLNDSTEIEHITLHNNPWICDCSTKNLVDVIKRKSDQIQNLLEVTCEIDNRPLVNLSIIDLCTRSDN